MKHYLMTAAMAALMTVPLIGCSSTAATKAEQKPAMAAEPTKPMLSSEAQQALAKAEADVKTAKSQFALWTVAQNALNAAQEAAKAGDSAGVIKESDQASKFVALGLAQNNYPSTEMQ
jgi:flagellar basal body L-ring protein FlgH